MELKRGGMWWFSTAISWATSRGEPSNLNQRTNGPATLVGLKPIVNSYAGVAGETPYIKTFGRGVKGKGEVALGMAVLASKTEKGD